MEKIKYCNECNNLVEYNGEIINLCCHLYNNISNSWKYICIDCSDSYFANEEIKLYKKWCKERNKKIDKKYIEQIKNGTY